MQYNVVYVMVYRSSVHAATLSIYRQRPTLIQNHAQIVHANGMNGISEFRNENLEQK